LSDTQRINKSKDQECRKKSKEQEGANEPNPEFLTVSRWRIHSRLRLEMLVGHPLAIWIFILAERQRTQDP
jgi:hypothetical protein